MNTNEIAQRDHHAHLMAEIKRGRESADTAKTRPARRTRKPLNKEEFTYRLHLAMLWFAGGMVLIGTVGHFFQPHDDLWKWAFYGGGGVLLGKFSNRIGQGVLPPKPGEGEQQSEETHEN